jgi:hypothetical protein
MVVGLVFAERDPRVGVERVATVGSSLYLGFWRGGLGEQARPKAWKVGAVRLYGKEHELLEKTRRGGKSRLLKVVLFERPGSAWPAARISLQVPMPSLRATMS